MAGMLNPPKAEGIQWPLMGRTFVFDDGARQAAIVCLDLVMLLPSTVAELRQAMSAGTGIDPADIMITCSHTHRGPYTTTLIDEDVDYAYLDLLRERLAQGMAQAWAERQPARLKAAGAHAPGWTFNRRPVYRSTVTASRSAPRARSGSPISCGRKAPPTTRRKRCCSRAWTGAPLGGLVNFACHTTVMAAVPMYSADFAGAFTEAMARRHGGIFGFMQGAAGNLWAIDMASDIPAGAAGPDDRPSMDLRFATMGLDHAIRMGGALAECVSQALAVAPAFDGSRVKTARAVLRIPQRRATKEQLELAKWYLQQAPGSQDEAEVTRRLYGHDYTFYGNDAVVQQWFAHEMIGMWEWQRRTGTRELIEEVEVQAIAIGEAGESGSAFVGYPAEMFTEFGLHTKAKSPFAHTIVAELANGWHGYIPTLEGFAHGGYESRFAYQSRLIPEAGDLMCDTALSLLQGLT